MHFWHIAAKHLRWELLALSRKYQKVKHHTDGQGKAADDKEGPLDILIDLTAEPTTLADWENVHEQIEALPNEARELFDLLWYDGLTQQRAAEVLGISLRTVRRRWQDARRLLRNRLRDKPPM